MMRFLIPLFLTAVLALHAGALAGIVHVPADQPTIQAGIDSSLDGDTVLVEPGIYYENINFHGKKIVLAGHYLLTGDYNDIVNTIIDGSAPSDPDSASCVLFINGEDSTTVLEGFTLTGGTGTVWQDIHNGNFYREGGGILLEFSAPVIRHNLIIFNDASGPGGTSAGGGGIRIGDANPTVEGNVIAYNTGRYGGGIVLNYTGAQIRNNIVYRNSGGADFGGSGIWIYANSVHPKIIENNTIMENVSTTYGGGVAIGTTSAVMRNNIIWQNAAPEDSQISVDGATLTVTYSDVQGGWPGTGNINAIPGIGDTTHVLEPGSPCIDAGNPAVQYNDPEDTGSPGSALAPSMGTTRNDMGAYGGPLRGLLYIRIHRNAPLDPSGVSAYSDYATPASITLTWDDPTELFNGDPIPSFELHLYRDSSFIATVPSGVETFTDTGLVTHQLYSYTINAVTAVDSSPGTGTSAYAGGNAFPEPPTGLTPADGLGGCSLRWLNPSRQLDMTPLNDLAMAYIYRDGVLTDSIPMSAADTGGAAVYPDTAMGYHWYRVVVRDDETPWHFSAFTDSVLGYGGLSDSYAEDFEGGIGNVYTTGSWGITPDLGFASDHSLTDSPTGNSVISSTTYAYLPPVRLAGRYRLQFQNIGIIRGGQLATVEISTDARKTYKSLKTFNSFFSPLWGDGSADSTDWFRFAFDLAPYAGDTATVRLKLQTSPFAPWDGWYLDDILLARVDPDTMDTLGVPSGWSMVSLPVDTAGRVGDLFPGVRPLAYTYDGMYVRVDSLLTGQGYWIVSDSSSPTLFSGQLIPADTIAVKPKWNMIGMVGYPVDSSSVRTVPGGILASSFYTYEEGSGYHPTTTLVPGKSFWVMASAQGKIILSVFAPLAAPKTAAVGEPFTPLSEIGFTDATGRRGTLRYGPPDSTVPPAVLPPPPPAGAFDLRFASGLSVERSLPDRATEAPILFGAVAYPLTVRWNAVDGRDAAARLELNGEWIPLSGRGERVISSLTRPPVLHLGETGVAGVPGEFLLAGNYPNPFNPATRISFGLPAPAMVTLTVYDLLGRRVAEVPGQAFGAGWHEITWDASGFAGGIYAYRLSSDGRSVTGKMVLMK